MLWMFELWTCYMNQLESYSWIVNTYVHTYTLTYICTYQWLSWLVFYHCGSHIVKLHSVEIFWIAVMCGFSGTVCMLSDIIDRYHAGLRLPTPIAWLTAMTVHCLVIQSLPFTATEVELHMFVYVRTYESATVGSRSGEYLGTVPNTALVLLRHYITPVNLLLQFNMQSLQIVLDLCVCVCVCVRVRVPAGAELSE